MIYFVQRADGGNIKIGTTNCLGPRLCQLRLDAGSEIVVLGIMDGSYADEKSLHVQFSHLRVEGEWFNPGDELLAFINQNASPWDGIAGRIRLICDVPERIRRALNLNAAKYDRSVGSIIEELVVKHLAKDLADADESIAKWGAAKNTKRGRPRKSSNS